MPSTCLATGWPTPTMVCDNHRVMRCVSAACASATAARGDSCAPAARGSCSAARGSGGGGSDDVDAVRAVKPACCRGRSVALRAVCEPDRCSRANSPADADSDKEIDITSKRHREKTMPLSFTSTLAARVRALGVLASRGPAATAAAASTDQPTRRRQFRSSQTHGS